VALEDLTPLPDAVEQYGERPSGRDLRVELPDGAGRQVARIGVWFLAVCFELPVQLLEVSDGDIRLTAWLENFGRPVVEAVGDRTYRPQLRGDVLSDDAVAACGAPDQPLVLVA
jgi:hypothetical protein